MAGGKSVQQYSIICTGTCDQALPHYTGVGTLAGTCPRCGGELRRIQGEPRGEKSGSPTRRTHWVGGPSGR
jgi:hypothetical protein